MSTIDRNIFSKNMPNRKNNCYSKLPTQKHLNLVTLGFRNEIEELEWSSLQFEKLKYIVAIIVIAKIYKSVYLLEALGGTNPLELSMIRFAINVVDITLCFLIFKF